MKKKVLVVDDQKSVRMMIRRWIDSSPNWEVVAEAKDPFEARDKILESKPDVMTLDVHMPGMDGIEFLKKLLPQYPLPVIMFSSSTTEGATTTLEALDSGAFDYVTKPIGTQESLEEAKIDLLQKLENSLQFNSKFHLSNSTFSNKIKSDKFESNYRKKIIVIGSSTGGTTALKNVLSEFNPNLPPTLIAQHMPENFTNLFAKRLKTELGLEVREAIDNEPLSRGLILIAPGNYHLTVKKSNGNLYTKLLQSDKVNGHRPSVEVLFESVLNSGLSDESVAVILTGMGSDGAKALLKLKEAGSITLGQDRDSCVVYGMPKVAYELGAVLHQLPLNKIGEKVKDCANL